ncbi:SGNH/GDSL hydrolase family protein [Dietzia sp. 179-F 9C3 NHS]|uniref:SGNH/GDSL hydrolase family protein n=1 Tax=Dietzia sp. 179-F 9C3 NHS TaxID=3374295 RepID=UPI003879A14E
MNQPHDPMRRLVVPLALTAVGTAGAYRGALEVLVQQAKIARRVIPRPTSRPFDGDGLYRPGASVADPWRPGMSCDVHMMIFGDSLAAGLGAETPGEMPGVLLARGLAEESGWDVRLSIKAIVGATSKGLPGQIEAMQVARGKPDISVILIGGNDITARNSIGPSARRVGEAVAALRKGGSHVVVGTCPDLGIIKPVPQPLRAVMATLSRRLAAAQAVQVRKNGGVPVSLAETLAPEFHARGDLLFSPDRFHPNSAGYELAAGLLLPAVCLALGVWEEPPADTEPDTEPEARPDADLAVAPGAEDGADGERDADAEGGGEADAEGGGEADAEPRESVVSRLARRLTDFVRTHEDADGTRSRSDLHNEDVDGDVEDTADAREAADTLRRRSRILRRDRTAQRSDDPES